MSSYDEIIPEYYYNQPMGSLYIIYTRSIHIISILCIQYDYIYIIIYMYISYHMIGYESQQMRAWCFFLLRPQDGKLPPVGVLIIPSLETLVW